MSDEYEAEATGTPDATKLSLIGGFIGTALGSRRSRGAAIIGGIVGGTLGYLAGKQMKSSEVEVDIDTEPVVVTIDGPEDDTPSDKDTA